MVFFGLAGLYTGLLGLACAEAAPNLDKHTASAEDRSGRGCRGTQPGKGVEWEEKFSIHPVAALHPSDLDQCGEHGGGVDLRLHAVLPHLAHTHHRRPVRVVLRPRLAPTHLPHHEQDHPGRVSRLRALPSQWTGWTSCYGNAGYDNDQPEPVHYHSVPCGGATRSGLAESGKQKEGENEQSEQHRE